ncbi:hypothetical protein DL768_007663 [Monosporascus sp. mg162]|nr:hypothetical protein DL768_007663 [Monosporascus sp. mg162]
MDTTLQWQDTILFFHLLPSSQNPEAAAPPNPAPVPANPPPRRLPTAADNIATIRRQAERIADLERQLQRMAEYCFECGELSRRTWEGFSDIHDELLFQLHREVRSSGVPRLWRAQQRIDRAQELARRQGRREREQREVRE